MATSGAPRENRDKRKEDVYGTLSLISESEESEAKLKSRVHLPETVYYL